MCGMSHVNHYPLVSVCITTFNRIHKLTRAIDSVIKQTYENIEIIIVDDHSTDGTKDFLSNLKSINNQINYYRLENNHGLSKARNIGIKLAKGDYIAFLDDDDYWKSSSLQSRMKKVLKRNLKKEKIGIIYSGNEHHFINQNRVYIDNPKICGSILDYCRSGNFLYTPASTFIFPINVIRNIGGFDESLVSSIDHDIWMKLAVNNYSAISVNKSLTVLTIYDNKKSMVSDTLNRIKGVEQFITKWQNTFVEWYGESKAGAFIIQYRAGIYGNLFALKFVNNQFYESMIIIRHLIDVSSVNYYCIKILIKGVLKNSIKKYSPSLCLKFFIFFKKQIHKEYIVRYT